MAEDHHVKFAVDTHLDPEPIHLLTSDDPTLPPEAHVGILRNHHTYGIEFPVTHSLGPAVSACHAQNNIFVTVTEAPETVESSGSNSPYVSTVKIQLKTIKEGGISEKIKLFVGDIDSGSGESSMEILVTAKVLKTNQGNPLLKNGVHVISHEHTEESDFTEWPGHGKGEEDMED